MTYFIGSRAYDFKNDAGERVQGVTVWFAKSEETGAIGLIPFKCAMNQEAFARVFGTETASIAAMAFKPVQVAFDEKGKPISVALAPAPKG